MNEREFTWLDRDDADVDGIAADKVSARHRSPQPPVSYARNFRLATTVA